MTSQDEAGPDKYFSIEKYFTHIPFIAVTVALTFDVGTFYAVGIDFFTVFSLSEHIVFALEALPVAIVVLMIIVILFPGLSGSSSPAAKTSRLPLRNKYQYIIPIVLLGCGLISFVAYLIYDSYRTNAISALLMVFILIGFVPAIGIFYVAPKFKQAQILMSSILVCVVVSFSFGFAFGYGFFNREAISIVRLKSKEAPIEGRIIRSGEKGVLLYDRVSKLVRLERWETISSIEARPQP